MRVAIIADYFLASMGYPKINLAKAWLKQKHTVKVLTSDRYFPFHDYSHTVENLIGPRQRTAGLHKENGIHVIRRPVFFEFFARAFFNGVHSFLKGYKPNVVVVFGISSCSAIQVALFKKIFNLKFSLIMVDSHLPSELELGNQQFKRLFYGLFRTVFSKLITQQTNRFIATQDKTIGIINTTYGISKGVTLIPNGTDVDLFKKDVSSRKKIRRQLNIDTNSFVIIYTGKIIPEKGVHILFEAFDKVVKKHPDAHLLLVGDGPGKYLSQRCLQKVEHRYHSQIIMVGFKKQSELFAYYSAADVAVWPLQESLAMNDAASCELPFIANHTLGDKTRISNDNALLYKKNNVSDLVKNIEKLYTNRHLRIEMGKRGRQLVKQRLSWNILAQQYLD